MTADDPGAATLRSVRSRLRTGSLWAIALRGGSLATGIAVQVALARLMSPDELGSFMLALAVIAPAATLALAGSDQACVRLVAAALGNDDPGHARRTMARCAALGLAGLAAAGLVTFAGGWDALMGGPLSAPALVGLAAWAALALVAVGAQLWVGEAFRAVHDVRSAGLFGGLLTNVLLLAGAGALAAAGTVLDARAATAVLALSAAAGAVLGAAWIWRRAPRGTPAQPGAASAVWPTAMPILAFAVVNLSLTGAPMWFAGARCGEDQVALLGAATRLAALVSMPLLVFNAVLPPLISEIAAQGDQTKLQRMLRLTAGLAAVPALGLTAAYAVFAGPLLGIAYGEYYTAARGMLWLLAGGQLANVLLGSCGFALMMSGNARALLILTAATACVALPVIWFATVHWGALGAAGGASAAMVMQNVVWWIAARRLAGVWTHAAVPRF